MGYWPLELEEGSPAEVAKQIDNAFTADNFKQWQASTPDQWALESLAILRTRVYPLPASGEIRERYRQRARPIIRTRLRKLGHGSPGC